MKGWNENLPFYLNIQKCGTRNVPSSCSDINPNISFYWVDAACNVFVCWSYSFRNAVLFFLFAVFFVFSFFFFSITLHLMIFQKAADVNDFFSLSLFFSDTFVCISLKCEPEPYFVCVILMRKCYIQLFLFDLELFLFLDFSLLVKLFVPLSL